MKMQNTKLKIQNLKVLVTSLLLTLYCLLFTASNAHAMHISEGILPLNWAVFWSLLAAPFVAYGLYRLKKLSKVDLSFKPLVGLMAAVVFIISCMPAISILVTAVALLIQALFLAHGGLSTWGADIVSMGVMGSFTGFLTFKTLRSMKINMAVSGFMAGLFADWATYITTSVELASGIRGDSPFIPLFWKILIAFIPTQLPLGILEGAMTGGMVVLLYKKRPDLLLKMKVLKPEEAL
jgi:cobalt/nickel transport system permease protein